LKKDYLADMGGERDLGDFAIIGASFDAQFAPKSDLKPLHWTHFHLGCCTNKVAVQRAGAKPRFKVVATLSIDKCIPKSDVKYLNIQGYVRQADLGKGGVTDTFDIDHSNGLDRCMTAAFKKPFVAEILGGGFEKLQNEIFEMLRHPRVKKLHSDRTWEDCVTLEDLERMADEKWHVPDADKLDGHAKDVALLVKKYVRDMGYSQDTATMDDTTQETTQRTSTQETSSTITPHIPRILFLQPTDAEVSETQQNTYSTVTSQFSAASSTHGKGICASVLVRQDTSERLATITNLRTPVSTALPTSSSEVAKKRSFTALISPPTAKWRRVLSPLQAGGSGNGGRNLGVFNYDSQDATIHIYAKEGVRVEVHRSLGNEEIVVEEQ
jgi:DNA ligase-4